VHQLYRSWQSIGHKSFKAEVDAQLVHSIALTYAINTDTWLISHALEIQTSAQPESTTISVPSAPAAPSTTSS